MQNVIDHYGTQLVFIIEGGKEVVLSANLMHLINYFTLKHLHLACPICRAYMFHITGNWWQSLIYHVRNINITRSWYFTLLFCSSMHEMFQFIQIYLHEIKSHGINKLSISYLSLQRYMSQLSSVGFQYIFFWYQNYR